MKFSRNSLIVLDELREVFKNIDMGQISALMSEIKKAKKIIIIGVGREGLATRSFTMRLMHLGFDVHWIWDDTTPALEKDDLLIATNGSGEIGHINYVIDRAKESGATVFTVTGDPEATAARKADSYLFIPASVYLGKAEVVSSIQPMGNLFEQSAWLTFDLIIMELEKQININKEQMESHHRNLE